MAHWFGKGLPAAAVATVALLSYPAVARPTSIRAMAVEEVRLGTILYRIASANAGACAKPEVITGLVVHDLTRYERNIRPAISQAFSIKTGFGVLGIVPGSAAADAGLRTDDEILTVGPYTVATSAAEIQPRSYRRTEQFYAAIQKALTYNNETELLVRRAGSFVKVPLRAKFGCGGKMALTSSSARNAWSDGKHVVVTTGMTDFSRSDDEIAFVIAHEMAHNILGHSRSDRRAREIFGFARIRQGEIQADAYAVRLMSNAGYHPAGGIAFLENARRRLWWNISLDHPGFGQRIKIITTAMRSIQADAAASNRLVAYETTGPVSNAPRLSSNGLQTVWLRPIPYGG